MDPVTMIAVPGLLGGIVLALIFIRLQRSQHRSTGAAFSNEPLSTDVINMSRIPVAGVGGLGLVAMALAVAWVVPRIGQVLALGLILGGALAGLLIAWRRAGPMPSSGRHPGANAMLSIDGPPGPDKPSPPDARSDARTRSGGFAPPHPLWLPLAARRSPRRELPESSRVPRKGGGARAHARSSSPCRCASPSKESKEIYNRRGRAGRAGHLARRREDREGGCRHARAVRRRESPDSPRGAAEPRRASAAGAYALQVSASTRVPMRSSRVRTAVQRITFDMQ